MEPQTFEVVVKSARFGSIITVNFAAWQYAEPEAWISVQIGKTTLNSGALTSEQINELISGLQTAKEMLNKK